MWRSNFEEDWERRKVHLIRSLFQDLPLSPIQEEDESVDSSRPQYSPSTHLPHRSVNERPYSPLPSLIIEKEPNRHDEPEEYYKKLEKKVLKVYRKLFIEGKSVNSDDSSNAGDIDAFGDGTLWEMQKSPRDIEYDIDKTQALGTIDTESWGIQESRENIEDDFEGAHNSDISVEINNKIGRKRAISNNDSDRELSKSKKSKCNDDSNGSSTDALPDSTSDEDNMLSDTFSSHTENRNICADTEVPADDKLNDTLILLSDNNRNIWEEIENEDVIMRDTMNSNPDERIKGTETGDKEDDKSSDSSSSDLDHSENEVLVTMGVLGSHTLPNLKDHRMVTVHADIHKDDIDRPIVSPPRETTVEGKAPNVDEAGSVFLENNEVPDTSHTSSRTEINHEIEEMRTLQIRPSVGSFHNQEHSASPEAEKNTTVDLEPRVLEELTESSSSDTNEDKNSSRGRKRSWLSDDTVYDDVGIQTSFNDDHDNNHNENREFWRDIFAGAAAPKVFRLSSCANPLSVC